MLKQISFFLLCAKLLLASPFLVSSGGFDVTHYKQHYCFKDSNVSLPCNAYLSEVFSKEAKNTNSVTIWITRNWQEEWFSAKEVQEQFINKGYTPIFIFYWFGDEISVDFIHKHEKEYFKKLKDFSRYLQKINGQKIVVLNPEYNMADVSKWEGMNEIFLKSFSVIRQDPQTLVGPCVGDFGNYKKEDEPKEWKLFHPSLNKAAQQADFIAFQEMRALTRNSASDILKTASRAYHFAKYLHTTYKKPTLLAYVALSSYGKDGESIQADAFKSFVTYLPKMKKEAKLLAFGTFHYFDYPGHVGYFNEAEEFFGIVRKNGSKKPSFKFYKKIH